VLPKIFANLHHNNIKRAYLNRLKTRYVAKPSKQKLQNVSLPKKHSNIKYTATGDDQLERITKINPCIAMETGICRLARKMTSFRQSENIIML